ncbi:unnamed protein product [Rotaria socialis]|uniref:Uncharacterized protein n=1 Tax=Rotaria socialis TaxID=392032 RepID=A0A820CL71_9BILA|nr:unnamed protein product [Rotaria socialis]CAF4521866.1 unnamed protein product [Rotaria socialis]
MFSTSLLEINFSEKHSYNELLRQGVSGEPFVSIISQLPKLRRARESNGVLDHLFDLSEKYENYFFFSFGSRMGIMMTEPCMIVDIVGRSHAHAYVKPAKGKNIKELEKMLNSAFHFMNLKSMISIMANETVKAIDSDGKSFTDEEIKQQAITTSESILRGFREEIPSFTKLYKNPVMNLSIV